MPASHLSPAQKIAIRYYRARLRLIKAVSVEWAGQRALDLFTKPYAGSGEKDPPIFRDAEKLSITSGGLRLAGYKWSSPANSSGHSLLIIHGFSGNSRRFQEYISPALLKGYDVYAYDAPAHGKSEGARLHGNNYLQALKDIITLHGHFDCYIAHSLGGMAIMLALDELRSGKERKIVLIAPATESKTAVDNFFKFLKLPNKIRVVFDEKIKKITGKNLEWFSVSRVLPENAAQLLWIHDEDDQTTPISDVLPVIETKPANVTFHVTKGLGHSRVYKDPDVRKKIIDFL